MTKKDTRLRRERLETMKISSSLTRAGNSKNEDVFLMKGPLNELTLVELKQLYEMYQADCNIRTICLYMRITKDYAFVCIEAAKWLYGGGLHKLQKHRQIVAPKPEVIIPKRTIQKFFKDDKRDVYVRPPAIYTNARPYDFDQI